MAPVLPAKRGGRTSLWHHLDVLRADVDRVEPLFAPWALVGCWKRVRHGVLLGAAVSLVMSSLQSQQQRERWRGGWRQDAVVRPPTPPRNLLARTAFHTHI